MTPRPILSSNSNLAPAVSYLVETHRQTPLDHQHLQGRLLPGSSCTPFLHSRRAALLVQLEEQRAHTLAEAAARARAAEELRMAEGAFPALGGAPDAGSYRAASGTPSKEAAETEEDAEDGVPREVEYMRVPRGPATRWMVSRDGEGGAKYVAPPPAPRDQSDHAAGRWGKGKLLASCVSVYLVFSILSPENTAAKCRRDR
ncbi:hypothetical protein EDB84DRAFT_1568714 [Lactarius hengduanensis]|nr:hypothetical protein EDB84DRAFT_1568714 [Lactarius hengduanensis]